jgi:cytochrome c oxidase subunit II
VIGLLLQSGTPFQLQAASSSGVHLDQLFYFLTGLSFLLCILIFGTLIYFAVRYRRRPNDSVPPVIVQSIPLEIVWTVIPIILNVVIFLWAAKLFFREAEPPVGATEIFVVGKQWMWHLQHAEGQREINELHIPVNVPVKLIMTSQDVIHDFFVPAFREKKDVVPGRYTTEWFQPTKIGRYHFFCAQYCGTLHSGMIGWVYVMSPKDYAEWMYRNRPSESAAGVGERLFAKLACNNCHQADRSGSGPPLTGVFGSVATLQNGERREVDEGFIHQIILNPATLPVAGYPQVMPSFRGEASEEEILEIIAYIKSMGQEQSQSLAEGNQ